MPRGTESSAPLTDDTTSTVREATPHDDPALVALAAMCPMDGDISLCVDREPSFFTLSRLEGDPWRVGVVDDPDGNPIACMGVARRHLYLGGEPTYVAYIGDLKVHPEHRRKRVAINLVRWAHQVAEEMVGADGVKISTVLKGNESVERGLETLAAEGTSMRPVGTIRSLSVPLVTKRRIRPREIVVDRAVSADIPEMIRLWQRIAPKRDGAPVLDEAEFRTLLDASPGLSISDYLLARRRGGDDAIIGFVGLWDQHSMKQMRVIEYASMMRPLRTVFNLLSPLTRVTELPAPGRELRYRNAVHLCIEPGDVSTLRALLLAGGNWLKSEGYSIFTVGVDADDPLVKAFSGMLAQPTDVTAIIDRVRTGAPVRTDVHRPLHFEISTV
ncbi:MAG: GNAT family N-acetyltransferase [Nocardia sp.]|nr:GNAT family N-acetyltransferase [Nocardia sp.]